MVAILSLNDRDEIGRGTKHGKNTEHFISKGLIELHINMF